MDNFIINRSQPTKVQFEMVVEGTSIENAKTRLIIDCEKYSLFFNCFRTNQRTFVCEIPPIPFIEKSVHEFFIEVIIDQQIFTPLTGTVTVVDDVKIEVASISPTNSETNTENEETEKVKSTQIKTPLIMKNSDDIINFLRTRNIAEEDVDPEIKQKDLKVREILESMNLVVKPSKPKRNISLKKLTEKRKK